MLSVWPPDLAGARHVPGTVKIATEIGAQDRDGGRRHTRNSQRMRQRIGLHLREPLDDLSREAGHALVGKCSRNPTRLVASSPFDFTRLPTQITGELNRGFKARDVDSAARGIGFEI